MCIVGGVCKPKGQLLVLKALKLLPKDLLNNIHLDIIGWGDSSYINQIKRFINSNGLKETVSLLGNRDDIHGILHNYQIGLNCSNSEGYGLSTIEYLCAGLAVIGSNSGATPELIKNLHNGLLYCNGDEHSLSNCIKQFYLNRSLLKKCSVNAYELSKSISLEDGVEKTVNTYSELVGALH
jgi:glycosyltransferase involved in cell wall biosynthesis